MDIQLANCIRKFIKEQYIGGGVIRVSQVAAYCQCLEGKLIKELNNLEKSGEVHIERRYSCPMFHFIRDEELPFCPECNDEYLEEDLNVYFYFKPLIHVGK